MTLRQSDYCSRTLPRVLGHCAASITTLIIDRTLKTSVGRGCVQQRMLLH